MHVEALKQLKARYCRLLDAKDWAAWRDVFTDELHADTSPTGGGEFRSADAFVAYVQKTIGRPSCTTVHQVCAPEIELTSPTSAAGVWAMTDVVRFAPGLGVRGYGHYHETYAIADGQWRIASLRLTRLRLDLALGPFSFLVPTAWYAGRRRATAAASSRG
ncbi:MAG: nuclear transport factor 2 family protein [Myxococcales bacterium]|nr:nuclear transport factor 2 family protein [Myxococcales bacterium]